MGADTLLWCNHDALEISIRVEAGTEIAVGDRFNIDLPAAKLSLFAKDTGLRNLPLHSFAANQLWLEIVALAGDLLAWTQHLALTGTPARTWEPKRLRLRLLNIAGRVITSGR